MDGIEKVMIEYDHMVEKINSLTEQNRILMGAVEFYGDRSNWSEKLYYDEEGCLFNTVMDLSDCDDEDCGKRARQALEKLKERE